MLLSIPQKMTWRQAGRDLNAEAATGVGTSAALAGSSFQPLSAAATWADNVYLESKAVKGGMAGSKAKGKEIKA